MLLIAIAAHHTRRRHRRDSECFSPNLPGLLLCLVHRFEALGVRNSGTAPGASASAPVLRSAVCTQSAAGRRRVWHSACPSRATAAPRSPAAVHASRQGSDDSGEYGWRWHVAQWQ